MTELKEENPDKTSKAELEFRSWLVGMMDPRKELYTAIGKGDIRKVEYLLSILGVSVNVVDEYNESLIHKVAYWYSLRSANSNESKKYLKIAKLLLEKGADPNATRNNDGFTPLHTLALFSKSTELAKLLIKHNADIYIQDHMGRVPAEIAAGNLGLDGADAIYLMRYPADFLQNRIMHKFFVEECNQKMEIESIVPWTRRIFTGHINFKPNFFEGKYFSYKEFYKLRKGNYKNFSFEEFCIYKAVEDADIYLTKKMLELGVKVNLVNTEGETLLYRLCYFYSLSESSKENQYIEIARLLCQYGADPNKTLRLDGVAPLHILAISKKNTLPLFSMLIKEFNAEPGILDSNGQTSYDYALNKDLVDYLSTSEITPKEINYFGQNLCKNLERFSIEYRINYYNRATEYKDFSIDQYYLWLAVIYKEVDIVKILLSKNIELNFRTTAITLFEHLIDIYISDNQAEEYLAIAKLLIDAGAQFFKRSLYKGKNALHILTDTTANTLPFTKMLIEEYHMDPRQKDYQGKSVQDYARNTDLLEYLDSLDVIRGIRPRLSSINTKSK